MSDKKHSRTRVVVALLASLVIFGFAGWVLLDRQYVNDQIIVWSFKPSDSVKALEARVDFTDQGKFDFYATQPTVAAAADFNKGCPRQEVGNPILGCYGLGKIYVYNITNPQLDGIEEVTAAHETLHAIWERTSPAEQQRLGTLLRADYNRLADSELKTRMDYYSRTEPGEFENELHSIIGTEMTGISPELETYYAQFFKDRSKVLAFHTQYESVFNTLTTQSDDLYQQLVTLGKSIEARSIQYNADTKQLSADMDSFNSRAQTSGFSSQDQFNRERSALVSRSNQLETDQVSINNDVATYNKLYAQYDALGKQIQLLNASLDSNVNGVQAAPSL